MRVRISNHVNIKSCLTWKTIQCILWWALSHCEYSGSELNENIKSLHASYCCSDQCQVPFHLGRLGSLFGYHTPVKCNMAVTNKTFLWCTISSSWHTKFQNLKMSFGTNQKIFFSVDQIMVWKWKNIIYGG